MTDELQPGPEVTPADAAEELCREDACFSRVPELADIGDDREVSDWVKFLLDLDDTDAGTVTAEDEMSGEGFGFIEDTRGGAVYVPYR